ncbi:hypothetical protein CEP52_006580 [Fusarium oligoseptatum]|uniref:Heterokaryon incompatibility domain-containing protein n=1 Tax=Fusarium oligoseptatum TaxID=2604345 RepID=A0A428TS89_9HYPO|nr:hypothetical protein CEP52_006580 [Fusarium oligoseptatum]
MSRWHKPTCKAPLIVVQKGTPWCKTCGAAPDLKSLLLQQKAAGPFTPPPRDEQLGQLNLSWPSSVPYVTGPTNAPKPAPKPTVPAVAKVPVSPVYPSRLALDEFRLISLSAPISFDDPIHIDLEVYKNERCPEYEATSYTWAGENGDGSYSMPIYVGPWWDVQIQTKNCWSMLRLMRPMRGCRMIWVDAICINQSDVKERDVQVSKMSQIYTSCRSVYLYLGAQPTNQPYPLRRQLQLSDAKAPKTAGAVDLTSLLQYRYFSRIWVIQELILSRQAIFQLGDVEFWMNSSTIKSLTSRYSIKWERTKAPWLEYLGQQTFLDQGLFKTLRAISKSQCTDPRDKIFGVLALIENELSPKSGFQANYGLSCQHTFMGVFAHALLKMRKVDVLRNAAGMDFWGKSPSWVPNWMSTGPDWIFKTPEVNMSKWEYFTFEEWWAKLKDRKGTVFLNVSARTARWKTSDEIEKEPDRFPKLDLLPGRFTWSALPESCIAHVERPWHLGSTVHSATGALGINLIHLLAIPSTPEFVQELGGLWLFRVKSPKATMSNRPVTMYLTANFRLDKFVKPGIDHLFVLDEGNSSCTFLIFERDGRAQDIQALDLLLPSQLPIGFLPSAAFISDALHETLQSIDLSRSLYEHSDTLCKLLLRNRSEWRRGTFDEAKVLAVFQGIFNESRAVRPGFLESYLASLDPKLLPKVHGDCIEVTIQPKDVKSFSKDHAELYIEFKASGKEWAKGNKWLDGKETKPFQLRASQTALRDLARRAHAYRSLSKVTLAARKTRQDEVAMARRGPNKQVWEDHFVALPKWPADIVSDFKIDGSTVRVNIA